MKSNWARTRSSTLSSSRSDCVRNSRSSKSTTPSFRFSSSRKRMKRVASDRAASAARWLTRRSITHAPLGIDPGVIQRCIQQRALEAFDDLELRVELRLDRELPQQRLAERMDRLRAKRVDPRQLRGTCAAPRVALRNGNFDERMRGAD